MDVPMKAELTALYTLQQLDSALDHLKRDFAALDSGQAEKTASAAAKAAYEEAAATLHADSAALKDAELEQQSATDKKADYEKKLYGGVVTNPKELMAMQAEIEMLDRQRARLDEKILALMTALESHRVREAETKKAYDAAKRALKAKQTQYRTLAEEITQQARALIAARPKQVKPIPPDLLKRYDALRATKGGLAIVPLEDGNACGGCKMGLNTMLVTLVREGDKIEVCQNCKRILCIPEKRE
jgi:uncharacterized protein